jgi:hypothetical protein
MQIGNWKYDKEEEQQPDKHVTWHKMVNQVNGFELYLNIHWTNHQPTAKEINTAFDQFIIDQVGI